MDGEVLSARLILTLGMAVAGLLAAFLAGQFMERDRLRSTRDQGAEHLYDDIKDMIDAALAASGWRMVHQAEQVELALKRRLGGAFKLSNDLQKHAKAAAGVFRDKPKDDHGHKEHGHGHAPAGSGVVYGPPAPAAAQANSGVIVMVGGSTGDAASHAHGGGHGGHGHDGDHHGHEPGHDDRKLEVRKALEAFKAYWADRGARIAEIKQAQRELAGEA